MSSKLIRPLRFVLALLLVAGVMSAAMLFAQAPTPAQVDAKVDSLLKQMTLEEKISLLGGSGIFKSTPLQRLGVPAFLMTDGPVGAHIPPPSTAYAAGIGLAATWDTKLAEEVGVQLGRDARSRGANYLLGPGVNIYRAPMNGRNFEYFGEDPFLGSRIAVGYIQGVQSQRVAATIKHYLGNNSEYARFTSDTIVDERTMREIYMPIFEAAVKDARAGAFMDSYNLTNGSHMTESTYLNTTVLRDQWHFDGLMMSDWTATHNGVKAINGGLDLEMPFPEYMNAKTLLPAIKAGTVKEGTIDEHVRRLLRVAVRFGWLDDAQQDITIPKLNLEGDYVALKGAEEGAVLLKNEGALLPLNKASLKNVAVIGPNAFPGSPTAGGSGEVPYYIGSGALAGIAKTLDGTATVTYARGIPTLHQIAQATNFTVDAAGTKPGIRTSEFATLKLTGAAISSGTENHIDYGTAGLGTPEDVEALATLTKDDFSKLVAGPKAHGKRWTGYYHPTAEGSYSLFAETSENCRLLVDDKLVIDSSIVPKALLTTIHMNLTAAPHKVVFEEVSGAALGRPFGRVGIVRDETIVDEYAKKLAAKADVVVLAVGFNSEIETEGSDREFALPVGQDALIREIAKVNPKTVVVITSGGAVDVTPWLDKVPAVLATWYAGQEGGVALAKVLMGDVNPSGRLPISWDRSEAENVSAANYFYTDDKTKKVTYSEGIFTGYRGYEHAGVKPQFPFGFGLSYTTYTYSNLQVHAGSAPNTYLAEYDVKNAGTRAGSDVSEVYVGEDSPSLPRPVKELKGFARTGLAAGETKHVTVELGPRAFTYYDVSQGQWHANAGSYTVSVGASSADLPLHASIKLTEAVTVPR